MVVEKYAPFEEGRDGQKIIRLQFFVQLRMCFIQWVLTAMAEILQNAWNFLHLETF